MGATSTGLAPIQDKIDGVRIRWYRSLYGRIAVGFFVSIAVVLAVQAIVLVRLADANEAASSEERLNRRELTRALSSRLSSVLESTSDWRLDERVPALHRDEHVFVIMKDGQFSGRRRPRDSVVSIVVRGLNEIAPGGEFPTLWERSDFAGAPIVVHGQIVGALGIVPRTAFERFGPRIIAIAAALIALGTLFVSLLIVTPVRSRLRDLQRAAAQLREGDLTARARVDGADEVTDLAVGFNAMAAELAHRTTALETSDRLRRQLITDVSHELMTPLTAVLGHLETLTMDEVKLDEAQQQQQIAVARREALRLERLIGDLLQAARLEAGGIALDRRLISIGVLFDDTLARHEHECRRRNITLVASVEDGQTLYADSFRIEQAVDNLMTNALRHTPDGGTIALRASSRGSRVVLEVSDSGEGISTEDLPFVFDRFYKTSSSSDIASPGSGLGLAIVKAIVIRHGGKVSATSAAGQGTKVTIELPASPERVEPVAISSP